VSVRAIKGKVPDEKSIISRLRHIRCWLLDMDGTVTLGENLILGAHLHNRPRDRYLFVTNNSSHGADHYMQRIAKIGLIASREQLVISTDAMVTHMHRLFSGRIQAFSVGTLEFERELMNAGIDLIRSDNGAPDVVLVGFDTTLTYEKMRIACDYIRKGIPYYATNPDKVCPLEGDRVLPDCGAILSFLETCTSKKPDRIFGKPDPAMIEMIRTRYGYLPGEMAMIGDRLYTDIAFALNAGIMGIAVLTGETTIREIGDSPCQPDLVLDHIADIAQYLI
jgi:HAD superfamily hydrolase (TIGR01450 family)